MIWWLFTCCSLPRTSLSGVWLSTGWLGRSGPLGLIAVLHVGGFVSIFDHSLIALSLQRLIAVYHPPIGGLRLQFLMCVLMVDYLYLVGRSHRAPDVPQLSTNSASTAMEYDGKLVGSLEMNANQTAPLAAVVEAFVYKTSWPNFTLNSSNFVLSVLET